LEAFCEDVTFEIFTQHTPLSYDQLQMRVDQVCEQGFIVSKGFRDAGGSSVAVPVRDQRGVIVACVNISGPDSGFDFDRLDRFYIPETQSAALRISRELGYAGR
jgi:IclR family pca regulon transcriptional regulator